MDRGIRGQRGGVCVGGGGTGGRVDRKTTGDGSGLRQSASHRNTTESHRRTMRPTPWYSLCHPPVSAHSPARTSVPFTLPCSLPPPTQASRAATDVSLFDSPAPPGLVCHCCVSPSSPRSSLSHHAPLAWRRLTCPVRSRNTDGRAEVGGRPGTRRRCWSPGVRLHRKKGDAHDAAAVLGIVPGCN